MFGLILRRQGIVVHPFTALTITQTKFLPRRRNFCCKKFSRYVIFTSFEGLRFARFLNILNSFLSQVMHVTIILCNKGTGNRNPPCAAIALVCPGL